MTNTPCTRPGRMLVLVKPRRIQRKRTKGWKMPPNTVYVGRPSKWGNPTTSVDGFRTVLDAGLGEVTRFDVRRELAGKNLACWCPLDRPCHADVLLEVANAPGPLGAP